MLINNNYFDFGVLNGLTTVSAAMNLSHKHHLSVKNVKLVFVLSIVLYLSFFMLLFKVYEDHFWPFLYIIHLNHNPFYP
jgi:hypothetical protein